MVNLWNVLKDYVKYFIKNIMALKNMNMLKDTFMNQLKTVNNKIGIQIPIFFFANQISFFIYYNNEGG